MAARFVSITALVLAVAGRFEVALGQKVCTPSPSPVFFKGSVETPVGGTSLQGCQGLCGNSTTCVGYLWQSLDDVTLCYQYSVLDVSGPPRDGSSDWRTGRCGAQLPQVNGDFNGNDLGNAPAPDAVQCSYTCEATKGCNAYSWTNFNGGTCWMKTARTTTISAPYDGSTVSGEVFKCSPLANRDIVGEDLASVLRADWRDCCGVCRRTNGCVASSWSNFNGGTCWLKKTNTGDAVVSGVTRMVLG